VSTIIVAVTAIAILIAWRLGTFRDDDRALTEDEAETTSA
jgi:hypothetical protein